MLVLSRRAGEKIVFPTIGVQLELLRIKGNAARIGIRAPRDVTIVREEIQDAAPPGKPAAAADGQPRLSHALRNRLHRAMLGLYLLQRKAPQDADGDCRRMLDSVLAELQAIEQEAAERKAAAPAPPRPIRTLLVEDDANESELLAGILRMNGFEVATAGDGADAIDYLERHEAPDVMLLDMIMPRCDGAETLRAVRSRPNLEAMKVFAISGTSPAALGLSGGRQGVDRWFQKPVHPETLVREMARELAQQSL